MVYVLLFSLALSLLATGLQLMGELASRTTHLETIQQRAVDLTAGNLSHDIWVLNYRDAASTLDTLLTLPSIQFASLAISDEERLSAGSVPAGRHVTQTFTLTRALPRTGQPINLGELTLVSSLEQAYQDLLSRALYTLLFQSLVVMLGSLGLLAIVRFTLSRHMEAMARYAARLNMDALIEPLQLKRKPLKHSDELSEMEQALNTMRQQLLNDADHLRQSTRKSEDERDQAVRANHAKNQFLANISHELRIPLQSALGYASLLAETRLDQEQREYVHTLQNATENLSSIVNDLLDISCIEAGKLELDEIAFDLRETLNDMVHMLGSRARDKGLALELRVDENLPFRLIGDPVRLRQMLINLTVNAIKFTDSGHVLISVEVLGRQGEDVRLRLAVEDTGVGIDPDDLPLVYEPYMQLGQRFQRQLPGAGLGLTICRQLVTLMKGSLHVESLPGEGSTFWVEVTLAAAADGATRCSPDTRMVNRRRILVVDSYELSRKITLEMLSRHDVDIEAVRSAADALAALRASADTGNVFDGVVLDGFVPDMDSDLLCQQIRSNPDWRNTRLLILSSNPQRGDAEYFRQAGADAFLSKSLRESCLAPMLHQLFADAANEDRQFLTRFSLQTDTLQERRSPVASRQWRVLLVEDNPVNRTLSRRLLEKLGCEVMTANDGEAAASLWQWHPFDIIFMDCIMPRVDGFEATRRLRAWEQAEQRTPVPVVALTASATEEDEERCRLAGMDSFVAKPVNIDMLRAVLEQYAEVVP
ncbi:hybrid sensor histidine kinase/response regulator [Marinobacter sp. X15-166B]|nr:hybrid sensor histidine kinase/response regulator [Marinobacter sp. X15-166B]